MSAGQQLVAREGCGVNQSLTIVEADLGCLGRSVQAVGDGYIVLSRSSGQVVGVCVQLDNGLFVDEFLVVVVNRVTLEQTRNCVGADSLQPYSVLTAAAVQLIGEFTGLQKCGIQSDNLVRSAHDVVAVGSSDIGVAIEVVGAVVVGNLSNAPAVLHISLTAGP